MIDQILKNQPPVVKAFLTAFIPVESRQQLDRLLDDLASDLANGRDGEACDKVRRMLFDLGYDLNAYRNRKQ